MTAETTTPTLPEVGQLAPDFMLPDDTGTARRLADARGKWLVLWFYPKDDTPGCTKEACSFRDADASFKAQDAEVWGVSVLGSGSKAAFKAKLGLPSTLLADEAHSVAEQYGAWREKQNYGKTYWGIARSTFLIDPEGRIARVWPKVTAEGHAEEVLAALEEARGST